MQRAREEGINSGLAGLGVPTAANGKDMERE